MKSNLGVLKFVNVVINVNTCNTTQIVQFRLVLNLYLTLAIQLDAPYLNTLSNTRQFYMNLSAVVYCQ